MADLTRLQQILGIRFKEPALLEQALIHSSYTHENPAAASTNNERMEFLGDAILGAVIAERLYHLIPGAAEGEMSKLRAALVSRNSLSQIAKRIGLDQYLYLGKGEEASGGRSKPSNLASVLEAVIAAIFLDSGWDAASDFVLRLFDTELKEAIDRGVEIDYKSRLQNLILSRQPDVPVYRIIEASGPAHNRSFTAEVIVSDAILGRGSGKSKKTAESEAARSALEKLA